MGFIFDGFPVIFGIFFATVIILFVVRAVKGTAQWSKNNASPVLNVQAVVATKRRKADTHMQQIGEVMMPMENTTYFVTFEVQSGSRMELRVNGREYGMLCEGDRGELVFQGTRYLKFTRV